jgi:hypothetical protein
VTGTGVNLELIQLSALIGTGLPVVAAAVKQDRLSQRANTVVAVLLTVAAAVAVTGYLHLFGGLNLLVAFTATYTTAVAFHHGLWQPTGIAPRLQHLTSVGRRRPAARAVRAPAGWPGNQRPVNRIQPAADRWQPPRPDPDGRTDLSRC